jgi:hypothetical protein
MYSWTSLFCLFILFFKGVHMKILLGFPLLALSTSALAIDSPCQTKQQNAAAYELAQEEGVPVQGVEILNFEFGAWTEAAANNSGKDQVTVQVKTRINRTTTIRTYDVSAKQIGSSDDCKIKRVEEAEL